MNNFIEISPQRAWEKVNTDNAIIVDIRNTIHYNHSYPKTAIHLNNQNCQEFLNSCEYDQPIMIICYHGISSRNTAQFFIEQGFDDIYSITGGFEAWQKAGLPIEMGC
ncbi:thiosulfate sulfurtransferase GlpE [Phocoenobacter skyensis]|uniref:Thiosulfate sulfurtransferase GlpE n=1 Tax=Phocoenobacter skyensis TaxID=97481 RepID=A0A1H7YA67_9PAST|nr:thiosulfate sulfurtransferase GlpE [Pasteurella skyensis]MDP8078770.1 thiosulfate sulfurtransferase GlpE [Pasteurella skyensis]MDP8085904.1 thiosulfate sulfurtransferase GlpE [Pasteurella skyensis]MDP8185962.1 thiosulfate sulfurtransferase GlpE [Pasteurella skyensis]QLB22752.1 thiosulfate sulfurtransferase [Pasteurella skyensis]SEM43126.1 thiosulfate sulfurtransferase [Pasteurella skyensis]